MPLDGIVLSSVVRELDSLLAGGRVEKINQTEKDEIVLTCHTFSGKYNLLISANPSNPRMHLTADKKDNPLLAPPFCMVLRKHIKGGKIVSVVQSGYDRVVTVNFEVFDELDGATEKHLIVEIMGKYSNIILTGKSGIIFDAVRHVDSSLSSLREILPAHYYTDPPAQDKISPEDADTAFDAVMKCEGKLKSALLSSVSGFSPMLCSCICERAGIDSSAAAASLSAEEKISLKNILRDISRELTDGTFSPCLFTESNSGEPIDFHCLAEAAAGTGVKKMSSSNMMLDTYYTEKDRLFRLSQRKTVLLRKINGAVEHCVRKNEIYLETLAGKEECELLRIRGELIKSYIYMIDKGVDSFTCVNYFDEEGREITIPLDKNLSPAANAAVCFKKYRKQKSAIESAEKFYEECTLELNYLESVKTLLENCTEDTVVTEMKEELVKTGYLKPDDPAKAYKTRKISPVKAESSPIKTVSSDGYEIFIGKNNRQNDMLTLKTASPDDIWLHVKDAPGSHVIIKTDSGNVSGKAIEEASEFAVGYSSIKTGVKAPVDYTRVKYVKKPSGARPGMVIFTNQKTIMAVGRKIGH